MKSDRIHFSVYVLYNVLYKDLFEVSEDPQMQNVCILLQESNHTFVLRFTFFVLYSLIYSSIRNTRECL